MKSSLGVKDLPFYSKILPHCFSTTEQVAGNLIPHYFTEIAFKHLEHDTPRWHLTEVL